MYWKHLVKSISCGYLKKSTPVVLRSILPDLVAEKAALFKVFILDQGQKFNFKPINRLDGLNRLLINDMMDREAFFRYMLAYSSCYPYGSVANHWKKLYQNLDLSIPEDVQFINITLPKRITTPIVDQLEFMIKA
jgi:hypothetical protein